MLPLGVVASAAPPRIFEQIGVLERFPADARAALGKDYVPTWKWVKENTFGGAAGERTSSGTIVMIPHVRQLWQFYWKRLSQGDYAAVVRDLDTHKIVKVVHLPALDRSGGAPGDWGHAIDDVHDRLFLLRGDHSAILEVDLKTFRMKNRPLPGAGGGLLGYPPVTSVGGIAYDRFEDKLLVLKGGPPYSSAGHISTFLYQMDLRAEQSPIADSADVYKVHSCTGPMTSIDAGGTTALWEVLVAEDFLWIPCQRAGHIGVVVRMRRPSPQDPVPKEDYIAGPSYATSALADQEALRIFMTSSQGEIWAFDARTISFLGVVATTDVAPVQGDNPGSGGTSWGLDPETGRYFYQNDRSGLGVVEGRFFPVPQALVDRTRKALGVNRIYSDHRTNRIFVLEGNFFNNMTRAYKIYRTGEAPAPPPPPSPDLNTVDMEERPGVTESRFFSRGSGYGFRAIWAGGWEKVIPAPPLGVLCPTCGINRGFGSGIGGGSVDREYYLGRVFQAEYDTGSTVASAIGTGMDDYSKEEFGFDGNPATCSAPQGTGKPDSDRAAELGPSRVHCPLPGGELRAYGEGSVDASVSVGRAWTETTITRINRGVLSRSSAVAQDIDIGGFIHIGEVRSEATSLANGRPSRQDMSTYTVSIKAVRIGENLLCNQCTDNEALVRALTTAGGPLRMQFRVGTQNVSGLDLALLRGSPGGALTAVQKSEARQAQDRVLVADTTTDVPGLEMTVFNDNVQWGRARQIYQFAGVSTVATYNIVRLPKAGSFAAGGSSSAPGSEITGGDPSTQLVESSSSEASADEGGIIEVIKEAIGAIGRGLRVFFSDPRQFMLLLTAWGLFGLAPYLARRRRLLESARDL